LWVFEGHLAGAKNAVDSLPKKYALGVVFLLGSFSVSAAQQTQNAQFSSDHNSDQITFVTSDANVKTILEEQRAYPSIDEAVSKVIPNHLIFYRTKNGNHKVHTVIEISDNAQWTDTPQALATTALTTSPAEPVPPEIDFPASGSAIDGKRVQVTWSAGNKPVSDWYLHIGTIENGKDLLDSGEIGAEKISHVVNNLPGDKTDIHVKLWYQLQGSSVWHNIKSSFVSNEVEPEPPEVLKPVSGATVAGSQTKIMWNAGDMAVNSWYLSAGTTENGTDVLDSVAVAPETNSYVVENLPQNGSPVYVKLRYQSQGDSQWHNVRTMFSSAEVPYREDLVALYNFDGDLSDASGSGLHGKSPAPLEFQSTPEGRSTVRFDGVDDHIIIGRSSKLDFSASKTFTFAAWVRLPDNSPLFNDNDVSMNLISKYDKGIAGEYFLDLRKSGRVGLLREASPFEKHSTGKIQPNQFSLVAGTYDGTVARIYVNGELSGSTAMGPSGSASYTDVVLGARHRRGSLENYFQGEMDKLLIYDRALTDTEILAMYRAN
jgi:hypothetical protein